MKRFFSLLLFVSISASMVWADAYRDALVSYLGGTQENMEQVKQSLGTVLQSVFPDNSGKAAQIMTEYLSTQGIVDIADIYEPAFRQYVSIEDLQEISKLYADPRYKKMSQRSAKLVAEAAQSPEYAQFSSQLTTAIQAIVTGGKAEPLAVSADVSDEYRQLFHTYYVESQIGDAMNDAYKPVISMLESSLSNNGIQNAKSIATSVYTYISANSETLFLNIYSKAFTEEDLHLLIEASTSPAQKNAMRATREIVSDPIALTTSMLTKMYAWLQVHYPDYAKPFRTVLDELQKME